MPDRIVGAEVLATQFHIVAPGFVQRVGEVVPDVVRLVLDVLVREAMRLADGVAAKVDDRRAVRQLRRLRMVRPPQDRILVPRVARVAALDLVDRLLPEHLRQVDRDVVVLAADFDPR